MTQEEKLQKEIARIVSCEEELNYFENKGDLIDFVARHFYEIGKNADETIRKELIFFLKEEIPQCSIKEHADKLKEFVYYLEKQKDTSQELEQEDEKMLDSVIRIITQFDDLAHEPTYAGPKWTHPYTKELAWLKSLRPQPHWKPSKEQTSMLLSILLESLYNDLKAL